MRTVAKLSSDRRAEDHLASLQAARGRARDVEGEMCEVLDGVEAGHPRHTHERLHAGKPPDVLTRDPEWILGEAYLTEAFETGVIDVGEIQCAAADRAHAIQRQLWIPQVEEQIAHEDDVELTHELGRKVVNAARDPLHLRPEHFV